MKTTALTPAEFPQTDQVLLEGLAAGVAPGFVAGIWDARSPELLRIGAWGQRAREPAPLPMLAGTIFDLASLTKVMATASLTATLVERGWLQWTTPVAAVLPG